VGRRTSASLKDGTVLDLAPGEKVDVSQAASWPESRRLPGEALREALLRSDIEPDPRGMKIRAAYIRGIIDLADFRFSFSLDFDSCIFEQLADWSRLTIAGLRLANCTTSGLTLNDAHIGGLLFLSGATLANEGGDALSLASAQLNELLLKPAFVKGRISLDAA
jgi:hypothetical protein